MHVAERASTNPDRSLDGVIEALCTDRYGHAIATASCPIASRCRRGPSRRCARGALEPGSAQRVIKASRGSKRAVARQEDAISVFDQRFHLLRREGNFPERAHRPDPAIVEGRPEPDHLVGDAHDGRW